jgi:dipeptidyl aminopeptidase/acylaminoacyl peptidase
MISSWYLKSDNETLPAVIIVHGFSPDHGKAERLDVALALQKKGFPVLLIETRGVGQSEGNTTTFGLKEWEDLEGAYDFLAALPENRHRRIGFLGHSLGGSVALIEVAETGKGDFVIAACPFESYDRVFTFKARQAGWPAPLGTLILQVSATLELGPAYARHSPSVLIDKVRVPTMIVWSTADTVIGQDQGERLFARGHEPKVGLPLNAPHDDVCDNPEFVKEAVAFLMQYGQN